MITSSARRAARRLIQLASRQQRTAARTAAPATPAATSIGMAPPPADTATGYEDLAAAITEFTAATATPAGPYSPPRGGISLNPVLFLPEGAPYGWSVTVDGWRRYGVVVGLSVYVIWCPPGAPFRAVGVCRSVEEAQQLIEDHSRGRIPVLGLLVEEGTA